MAAPRRLQLTLALLKPDAVAHPLVGEVRARQGWVGPGRAGHCTAGLAATRPPPSAASSRRPCTPPSSVTASSLSAPRSCAAARSRAAASTGSTQVRAGRSGVLPRAGAPWGPVPTRSVSLRRAFLLPAAGGVHGQVRAAGVRGAPRCRGPRDVRRWEALAAGRSVGIVACSDSGGTWWVAPPKVGGVGHQCQRRGLGARGRIGPLPMAPGPSVAAPHGSCIVQVCKDE